MDTICQKAGLGDKFRAQLKPMSEHCRDFVVSIYT